MDPLTNKTFGSLKIAAALIASLALSACGGGTSDDTKFLSSNIDKNVALASNGGVAFSEYDTTHAYLVNDGDKTTSNYWAGNVSGDYVRIDFGSIKKLKSISVYTNEISFNSANQTKLIELSSDNVIWKTTAQPSGGAIACTSLSLAGTTISCTYAVRQDARYIRFKVTAPDAAVSTIQVYEIEALGY